MKPSDDAESRKQPQKLQQQHNLRVCSPFTGFLRKKKKKFNYYVKYEDRPKYIYLYYYYKITSDLLLWNKMFPSQKLNNKEIKNHNI